MKNIITFLSIVMLSVQSLNAQTSSLTNYDYLSPGNGLAVWLKPNWKSGMQKYEFRGNHGSLIEFNDGTGLVTGNLVNINDSTDRWYIELALKNKQNWTAYSAAGKTFCDPKKLTDGQHKNWSYYEIDEDEDNILEDISGKYGYAELTIEINANCGIQVGYGANGVSAVNGLGGMFSASGTDETGTLLKTTGGFCTAICPAKEVKDHFQAFRFDKTSLKPYSHALYMRDDSLGVVRYIFGSKGGVLTTFHDGTAHLYGEVFMTSNNDDGVTWKDVPNNKFEINIYFKNAKNWSDWSANGNGFYDTYNMEDGNHVNWTYYIFDDSKPNTLTGRNSYNGTVLHLNHQPSNLTLAVQLGKNATSQNVKTFGMGGWFTYTVGKTKSNFAGGRGDLNLHLKRTCVQGEYMFGIKGGKSNKNKRIYYLEESNAFIEGQDLPFKSAALAAEPNTSFLYFIQNVHPYNLAKYDVNNGTYEVIGKTGFCRNVYRLDFNASGTLYASRGALVYTINTSTGKATCIGKMKGFGKKAKKSRGDIAFSPNGDMYLLTKSHLYEVNLNTLHVSTKGKHGISLISGMDFNSNGDLYVSNIIKEKGVGVHSNIYTMNSSDASPTLVGDAKVRINDLTFLNGCYSSPENRKPSCSSKVKKRKKGIADNHRGVVEYDQDFSDLENDEDYIAIEELDNISIYPTLVNESLNGDITLASSVEYENLVVTITDNSGRQVKTINMDYVLAENTINIGELVSGIYFVNVNLAGITKSFKIIVAK